MTSDLARLELIRAVLRTVAHLMGRALHVLITFDLLTVSESTFGLAASFDPVGLRTFDALHLSLAIELGEALQSFVVYDNRILEAAKYVGLATAATGATD